MSTKTVRNRLLAAGAMGLLVIAGLLMQFGSRAAGPFVSTEPELGTLKAPAALGTDTTASGGKYVKFGSTITPPANPLPFGYGQTGGPSGSWTLKFNDNFDGTSVDSASWSNGFYAGSTAPAQAVETACYDPSMVAVTGGFLHLTSKLQNSTCSKGTNPHPYITGGINTLGKKEFSSGYFEARMKLDSVNGQVANWPAWWTDTTGTWPDGGELDVMEGLSGNAYATWHGPVSLNNKLGGMPAGTDWSVYHTFAAERAAGVVTTYYDGKKVGSYSSTSNVPTTMHFLILGNQMSPQNQYGGPVKAPSDMIVDYVRVWQR